MTGYCDRVLCYATKVTRLSCGRGCGLARRGSSVGGVLWNSPLTIPIIHCSVCVKYSLRNGPLSKLCMRNRAILVGLQSRLGIGGSVFQGYTLTVLEMIQTMGMTVQLKLFSGCRYAFTILSNVLVFSCIWVLLSQINNDADVTNLTPNDKKIFWVSSV